MSGGGGSLIQSTTSGIDASDARICMNSNQLWSFGYVAKLHYDVQNIMLLTYTPPGVTLKFWSHCGSGFSNPGDKSIDRGFESEQKFEIKPVNPFDDYLILHCSGTPEQELALRLVDMTGRLVLNQTIQPGVLPNNSISIPTDDLTGVYFLHVETEPGNFVTRKVVKI